MIITSILSLLLSNSVALRRDLSILYSRISILILIYCLIFALNSLYLTLDRGIGLFGGLFNVTPNTQSFKIFIFFISALILQLTGFYPRKILNSSNLNKYINLGKKSVTKIINKMGEQFTIIEYALILLFIITGAILLLSSGDTVSIFLSLELQSYGLYLLSTLYRNSESATSSGLTYFLLGGLSSCFILFGIGLIYANSGTTYLDSFYLIANLSNLVSDPYSNLEGNLENILASGNYKNDYITYSLLFISVGLLFKISAAPFHFWSPDVYDGIPTIVTTFVALIAKISILLVLLELIHYTSEVYTITSFSWVSSLLLSSFFSLIIGTILGLTQFRIKRLYAYSTISHIGFILLALSVNSIESIQAFIFYLIQYTLSNLNAFIILLAIGYSLFFYTSDEKKELDSNIESKVLDKKNSPVQLLNQIKGYFYINPFLALSFAITIFSFVGIPPLIGFFGKQMVLSAALDKGYIFISLVAIITSVIAAVYYLNIIKIMFFYSPDFKLNPQIKNQIIPLNEKDSLNLKEITLSSYLSLTISFLTFLILLFIFTPALWLSFTNNLALISVNN